MDKPIPIVIDETKQELLGVLNMSGLPACIIAPIVRELYDAALQAQQAELERARSAFEADKEDN